MLTTACEVFKTQIDPNNPEAASGNLLLTTRHWPLATDIFRQSQHPGIGQWPNPLKTLAKIIFNRNTSALFPFPTSGISAACHATLACAAGFLGGRGLIRAEKTNESIPYPLRCFTRAMSSTGQRPGFVERGFNPAVSKIERSPYRLRRFTRAKFCVRLPCLEMPGRQDRPTQRYRNKIRQDVGRMPALLRPSEQKSKGEEKANRYT